MNITCPRQLFGHDLKEMVTKFTSAGHNIIIQGDFNSEYEQLSKWMSELGLIDLVNKTWTVPNHISKVLQRPTRLCVWRSIF